MNEYFANIHSIKNIVNLPKIISKMNVLMIKLNTKQYHILPNDFQKKNFFFLKKRRQNFYKTLAKTCKTCKNSCKTFTKLLQNFYNENLNYLKFQNKIKVPINKK